MTAAVPVNPTGILDAQIRVLRDARTVALRAVQEAEREVVATGDPASTVHAVEARQLVHDFTDEIDILQAEIRMHAPHPRPPAFGS